MALSVGFNRGHGHPLYTASVSIETRVGHDHQQVARANYAASWGSSPNLSFFFPQGGGTKIKAQTLDPVFAHGQLYVALSRVSARDALRVAVKVTADSDPVEHGVDNIVWKEVFR